MSGSYFDPPNGYPKFEIFTSLRALAIESDVTGSARHRAQQIEKIYVGRSGKVPREARKFCHDIYVGRREMAQKQVQKLVSSDVQDQSQLHTDNSVKHLSI